MRELSPSDSTFEAMCSGYESGWPSKVMWWATTTAGSGQFSSSRVRRSFVCGGSFGMSRGTGRVDFGTRPRYCWTSAVASFVSKSPTMTSVALFGT